MSLRIKNRNREKETTDIAPFVIINSYQVF